MLRNDNSYYDNDAQGYSDYNNNTQAPAAENGYESNEAGESGGDSNIIPYVGGVFGAGSEVMFSEKLGTWMGKDGKLRSQRWGGNGITGGKFKFAGKASSFLKWAGTVIGIYGVIDTYVQYKHNEFDRTQLIIEEISNAIGFIPAYGTAWSIFWNLGEDYGPSTWYGTNDYKWFK